MLPPGSRPAVYHAGKVGQEVGLDADGGQAWVALQLEKRHRYWQHIQQLIAAHNLALTPGLLPHLAHKSAGGVYTRLPLVEWGLSPLRTTGGTYAVSAADVLRRLDEDGMTLPGHVLDQLYDAVIAEALAEAERARL